MNFLRNLAFQFWPLALMVAAIWTLPEKYHQALGQWWVALIAGFMIAGGVIMWSMAARMDMHAREYIRAQNFHIRAMKTQISFSQRAQAYCQENGMPELANTYNELLGHQKTLLRLAEHTAEQTASQEGVS